MKNIGEELKRMGYKASAKTPTDDPAAVEGCVPSPTIIFAGERSSFDIYAGHNTVEFDPLTGKYSVEGIEITMSGDESDGAVFTGHGDGTSCPV